MPNLINQIQIGDATYDVGYPLIEGGGTTDATAKTSTWTGTHSGITSYYDGLTIRYKIGVAGQTTTTLNINGLGAKRIYRFNTTTLTTHFPVGSIINLTYHTDLNDGCWMCNDYDANTNTQARTYKTTSTATYYPVLTRYSTSTPTTYTAEYTRYSSKITANHGSGYLKAVKFIEDGVELEDKYSPIGHGHTLDAVTDTTTRIAMTPAERTKLAGIATNANNYNHPTTTAATGVPTANSAPGFGGTFQVNQVSRDALGHVSAITPRTITIPNSTATTTTYGLMSAADKAKLDGIATGANKYSLPTATTTTLGGVKIGTNLTITTDGVLSANAQTWGQITNKPTSFSPTAHTHNYAPTSHTHAVDDINGLGTAALKDEGYFATSQSHEELMENFNTVMGDMILGLWGEDMPENPGSIEDYKSIRDIANEEATAVKNELLNGAGTAYDTLKELGDLIDDNQDAIEALEKIAITPAERTKLSGIEAGANKYVLPTATSSTLGGVKVGSNITLSDGTISLSKTNVTTALGYTPPTTNTTYATATTTANGLMSSADKVKLNGIATNANNYTHPTYTEKASGLYKITVDGTGHVSAAAAVTKSDITALGIPSTNTTYGTVTTSANGLMSAADKTKLDSIAEGANRYVLPTATATTLGGVKIGSNITLSDDTISITKTNVTTALGYTPPTTNTTYTNASLGQGYGTCSTAAATTAKVVTLSSYSLSTGGMVAVKFTYAVPANATMNINSKGAKPIYYKGKAIVDGVINAGEIATFIYDGTQYHLLTVDRNRFFTSLVPYGTQITASSSARVDLNTPAYLKVGNYFCSANAQAEFISNLPKAKTAFMMQVYSPLSQTVDNETGTWVYRLRKIIFYTGEEYTQYCYTDGTGGNWKYGDWLQIITSNKTATTTSAGLMSSTDKVKLNGIEDVIDEKIAAAITTTLNTEV